MGISSDVDVKKRKSRGQLTAEIGKTLKKSLNSQDYDVFYDHDASGGKIVSYFGDKNERGTQLSQLDIAIVDKNSNTAVALVEIEETVNRPKTVIADIFGFLMGEKVAFQRKEIRVGKQTVLFVFGFSKVQSPKHEQYILDKVARAKSVLGTENCEIQEVLIETYADKDHVFNRLMSLLNKDVR